MKTTTTVKPGQSITITSAAATRTFSIGDTAAYQRGNLTCFNPIAAITEKTVTLLDASSGKTIRLTIEKFAGKNWNPDLRTERMSSKIIY